MSPRSDVNISIFMSRNKKLILPCLRGKIGDWRYYVTLLKFSDVADRVSMVPEIHNSEGLSDLIQREVSNRTSGIVEYLKTQNQRFFNSLILGVYGGHPKWHELSVEATLQEGILTESSETVTLSEAEIDHLGSSLGVLILDGNEKIFAIDGQHRTKAIKVAYSETPSLKNDEVAVILVAHKKTNEGVIRTRRLFSTLNRYAKPVSKSEIIAIDEEDNCAIITRNLVENFSLFKDKILFNRTRSISISNRDAFTNVVVLYDFVMTILTDNSVFGIPVSGRDHKKFTHRRQSESEVESSQAEVEELFTEIFATIPVLKSFAENPDIDRRDKKTSLLFKPVGQNVLYSTLKVAIDRNRKKDALDFFASNDFSLANAVWNKIFTDQETGRMKTDKTLQKFAFQIILKHLGINIRLTDKDKEVHEKFGINSTTLQLIERS